MPSGPQPKRVVCPTCGSVQGLGCVDKASGSYAPVKPHAARVEAAELWYVTKNADGLTPQRRDEMVDALNDGFGGRGKTGKLMEKITTSKDPEAEFLKITGGK
jgi:hypothetical protein